MVLIITILAGGLGKRMNSIVPKVLCKVNGEPMIKTIVHKVFKLSPSKILIVVGKFFNEIKDCLQNELPIHINNIIEYVFQRTPLGTGHAVLQTLSLLPKDSINMILNGDMPCIKTKTLQEIVNVPVTSCLTVGINLKDSYSYGRVIVKDSDIRIIEESECNAEQKKVTLVNCGIYVVSTNILTPIIKKIKNNNSKGEYYLTDMLLYCRSDIYILDESKCKEVLNINTQQDLEKV